MNQLTNVIMSPLESNKYMEPLTMQYTQNGKKKTWDLLLTHNAVSIILYNKTRKVLVFVKQFRPAVYVGNIPDEDRRGIIDTEKYPAELGITLEFCGGLMDKNIPGHEIAAEEVLEECGYKIDGDKLEKVATYCSGVGRDGGRRIMYYGEVTDDMKVGGGGGVDDEVIDVVELPIEEVKKYLEGEMLSPPNVIAGVYWFLYNKVGCYS